MDQKEFIDEIKGLQELLPPSAEPIYVTLFEGAMTDMEPKLATAVLNGVLPHFKDELRKHYAGNRDMLHNLELLVPDK